MVHNAVQYTSSDNTIHRIFNVACNIWTCARGRYNRPRNHFGIHGNSLQTFKTKTLKRINQAGDDLPYVFDNLFIGKWRTICFAVGLSAAIYSIKRKCFVLSIIGTSLLLVTPFVVFAESSVSRLEVFGMLVLILSFLDIVFVSISKGEFTWNKQ